MTGKTHLLAGASVAGAQAIFWTSVATDPIGPVQLGAVTFLCLLGSMLPDMDLPTSTVGQKLGVVSRAVNKVFGHRGFFHSLVFCALPVLAAMAWAPWLIWAGMAVSCGIASHVLLDLFNKAGEQIFWPLPIRIHILGIGMGSMGELWLMFFLIAANLALWSEWILRLYHQGGS